MTGQENNIIDLTTQIWNEFMKLGSEHPDEVNDFRFHLHSIQRIVFTRAALKDYNNNVASKPKEDRVFINIDTSTSTSRTYP